jgi:predicted GIY-YIG superfamily endonuclease
MVNGLAEKQKTVRGKRPSKPWFVYMLRCSDGTFYTGITNDVDRRLNAHRFGKGARYTRTRLPLELIYREKCRGRSAALVREYKMKAYPRSKKEKLALRFQSRGRGRLTA